MSVRHDTVAYPIVQAARLYKKYIIIRPITKELCSRVDDSHLRLRALVTWSVISIRYYESI